MYNYYKYVEGSVKIMYVKKLRVPFSVICSMMIFLQPLFCAKAADDHEKKFGLFSYSYGYVSREYAPGKVNIGDYIQSLAAKQFFPNSYNSILIDRDNLGLYNGPKVKMIMNSWYYLNKNNKAFSNNIDPIFVSLHINNTNSIAKETVEYLKKHEPIGCRDYATSLALNKKGVNAYFSGCLTTTLDEKYKVDDSERTDEIIFCDYKMGWYPKADEYLKSLKEYNFDKVTYTNHEIYSKKLTHEERFKIAEDLLKKYAKAKLVVTSRIHCARPCLALGTPVILVKEDYDKKRFDGLYDLLNTIGKDKKGNFKIRVNLDKTGKVFNSKDYLKYAEELKRTVRSRVSA